MLRHTKEIGGYFGIELPHYDQFPYPNTYFFNTARSAFYCLLQTLKVHKILMPKFICDSMLTPIALLGVTVDFYSLDKNFYPILDELTDDSYLLYVNYFGLCTANQQRLLEKFPKNKLIFDNSQSFFTPAFDGIHTIYSLRKFLSVADGGILITTEQGLSDIQLHRKLYFSDYYAQYQHLVEREVLGANSGYTGFQQLEKQFDTQIPEAMSPITQRLLSSFDYEAIKKKRLDNFLFLHDRLGTINELDINILSFQAPLTYPFLYTKTYNFTEKLIQNKVYVPTYWQDSVKRLNHTDSEMSFLNNMTHLICDQRYSEQDMVYQIRLIKDFL